MTKNPLFSALLVLTALFAVVQVSQGALYMFGPLDAPAPPGNGFPLWYQDHTGLALAPCLTEVPANPLINPFCVLLGDAHFLPAQPVSFPDNFPTEFFYWVADVHNKPGTVQPGLNADNVKVIRFALEGTFGNVPAQPADGFQTVFQRIRINFTPPTSGIYTFTHPFGIKSYSGLAPGVLHKDTIDVPLGIPMDFITTLSGPIGPFFGWDSGLPITDLAGNQYIGDPTIPHTVTSGPGGNLVRVDGTDIGGAGVHSVQTDLFLVAGMVYPGAVPAPLVVERSTYRMTASSTHIDVFADAAPGGSVSFFDGIATTVMAGDGSGRFFGLSSPASVPLSVSSTASNAPNLPTTVVSGVSDVVTITKADYSLSGQSLAIEAASSDEVSTLTLTAPGFGLLAPTVLPLRGLFLAPVLAPPGFVTVVSSLGGVHTHPVRVLP